MTILLATNNAHKKRELAETFPGNTVLTPEEAGISYEYDETGTTFFENSYGKAAGLWAFLHGELVSGVTASRVGPEKPLPELTVLADDSGIVVPALGGPGVYSARYGRDAGITTDTERTLYLLSQLADSAERDAYYVCCMVAVYGKNRFAVVQEQWDGVIADSPSDGKGGFGYDPIFYLAEFGCTAADISSEQKNAISHRGKAARAIARALDGALRS